ncbi:MAG: hypothetical protein NTW21_01280, partial [Verrucomicrobia bacterium]|nr:hypothetical protein [Verrucomicrobiota bacterium]
INSNGTLTNQDNTIRGFGSINSNLYFVNNGTVTADVDGRYLYLSGPTSGTGTYTASNGGVLGINSVVTGGIFSGPFSGGLVTGVNGTLIRLDQCGPDRGGRGSVAAAGGDDHQQRDDSGGWGEQQLCRRGQRAGQCHAHGRGRGAVGGG